MRQCPKCGRLFPEDRKVCNLRGCKRKTVEVIDWTDTDKAKATQDLEDGILEDPFEDYEEPEPGPEPEDEVETKPEPEPDLREDLKGQADQIHDILEDVGPLTYTEISKKLDPPVSAHRASRLIGQMIRDGVELKREGSPRKVSIG